VPSNKPVLEAIKIFKENGVHVEITNLIIPRYNDKKKHMRELVNWVVNNLGKETPIHFSRFNPHYKMEEALPTPIKVLDAAWKIAVNAGMKYVYLGNVPGHSKEDTYCTECKELVIKRTGYQVEIARGAGTKGKGLECPSCGEEISLKGKRWMK